ncbi:MAG: hypothetical protein ACRC8S_05560 [Fimbriiglobus sp.]
MKSITLLVARPDLARIDDIALSAKAMGMVVTQILSISGQIIGEAHEKDIPRLQAIAGVFMVRVDP